MTATRLPARSPPRRRQSPPPPPRSKPRARPWMPPGSPTKPAHCAPTYSPGSRARSASSRSKLVPAGHDTSHVAAAEKELASAQSRSDQAAKEHARLDRQHRDHDCGARRIPASRRDSSQRTAHRPPQPAHRWRRTGRGHERRDRRSCTVTGGRQLTAAAAGPGLTELLETFRTPITPDDSRDDLTQVADAAATSSSYLRRRCGNARRSASRQSSPRTSVAAAPAPHAAPSTGTASSSMGAAAPRPRHSRKSEIPSPPLAPLWSIPLTSLPPGDP